MPNFIYKGGPDDPRNATLPATAMQPAALFTTDRSGLVRFEGTPGYATNTCVAPGFACGLNPTFPQALCDKGLCATSGPWTFFDFSVGTDGFFIALWQGAVPNQSAPPGTPAPTIGFLEAAPASMFKIGPTCTTLFCAFQEQVLQNNTSPTMVELGFDNWVAIMTLNYRSVRGGVIHADLLAYTVEPVWLVNENENGPFDFLYPVQEVSNISYAPPQDATTWPLAQGMSIEGDEGVVGLTSVGHSGKTSLTVLGYPTCTWDLSIPESPQRTSACDTPPPP
jgi:hypothetical protein